MRASDISAASNSAANLGISSRLGPSSKIDDDKPYLDEALDEEKDSEEVYSDEEIEKIDGSPASISAFDGKRACKRLGSPLEDDAVI